MATNDDLIMIEETPYLEDRISVLKPIIKVGLYLEYLINIEQSILILDDFINDAKYVIIILRRAAPLLRQV